MLDSLDQALGDVPDVSLTLFDPVEHPWAGRVFAQDADCVLANSPVPTMSIRHGDRSHAHRWLVQRGLLAPGDEVIEFLPRSTYGRYIVEHASALVTGMGDRGWRVEFVREQATALERDDRSGLVVSSAGRQDRFDYVILCAGGSVHSDPFHLAGTDGYVAAPYPTRSRLSSIPAAAAVGIVGSGLSAVDAAVALQAQAHTGPVTFYSRSGVLPLVRRPGPDWVAHHLTTQGVVARARSSGGLRLEDLEDLFDREVQASGGTPRGLFPPLPNGGPEEQLRWQLDRPIGGRELGTLIFQKSVPTAVWGHIWYLLRPQDKRRLIDDSLRQIMARCSPMPPVNARKLLAMFESRQLRIRAGLESVQPSSGSFQMQLASGIERADVVVNAVTPATYGVHPHIRPLVDRAVEQGLAREHPWGGLRIGRKSGAVAGGDARLYALGNLTRGAYFFIFALPALVARSAEIAEAIRHDALTRTRRPFASPAGNGPALEPSTRLSIG